MWPPPPRGGQFLDLHGSNILTWKVYMPKCMHTHGRLLFHVTRGWNWNLISKAASRHVWPSRPKSVRPLGGASWIAQTLLQVLHKTLGLSSFLSLCPKQKNMLIHIRPTPDLLSTDSDPVIQTKELAESCASSTALWIIAVLLSGRSHNCAEQHCGKGMRL